MRLSRLAPLKANPPRRPIAGARNLVGKGRMAGSVDIYIARHGKHSALSFAQHMGRTIKSDLQLTKEPGLS